jgi:hypothetical protein
MKSKRISFPRYVAHMHAKSSSENMQQGGHVEYKGVYVRIILMWMSQKCDGSGERDSRGSDKGT